MSYPEVDDPIGDGLATALCEIEEFSGEERYSMPELAAHIQRVKVAMEDLQLAIDQSLS
jgi:hypothetical protein